MCTIVTDMSFANQARSAAHIVAPGRLSPEQEAHLSSWTHGA
jgi:hypothetical protein